MTAKFFFARVKMQLNFSSFQSTHIPPSPRSGSVCVVASAAVVGSISSLGSQRFAGGNLQRSCLSSSKNILMASWLPPQSLVWRLCLHGYNYSGQKKNMKMLVGESDRLADVIVDADDATRYRVNRKAGNTSEISRLPNNTLIFMLPSLYTLIFMLPSLLKLAIIFGVTFALVVLAGKIGDKIAKH